MGEVVNVSRESRNCLAHLFVGIHRLYIAGVADLQNRSSLAYIQKISVNTDTQYRSRVYSSLVTCPGFSLHRMASSHHKMTVKNLITTVSAVTLVLLLVCASDADTAPLNNSGRTSLGRSGRARRGIGYKMKCTPRKQRKCKHFKFANFSKKLCVMVTKLYCTALD